MPDLKDRILSYTETYLGDDPFTAGGTTIHYDTKKCDLEPPSEALADWCLQQPKDSPKQIPVTLEERIAEGNSCTVRGAVDIDKTKKYDCDALCKKKGFSGGLLADFR